VGCVEYLKQTAGKPNRLTKLRIVRCKLSENDFEAIASNRFKNLQELVLLENDNRFGDKEESKREYDRKNVRYSYDAVPNSLKNIFQKLRRLSFIMTAFTTKIFPRRPKI